MKKRTAARGGCILLLLTIGVAAIALLVAMPAGDVSQQLVDDVLAHQAALSYERPSHVAPPLAGSFGEHARSALLALTGAGSLESALRDSLRQVAAGDLDYDAIDEADREALDDLRPHVEALIRAATAERGDPPAGLGFMGSASPQATDGWIGVQLGARMVAVDGRADLDAGDPSAAARRCVGYLAVLRDSALGGPMLGSMLASSSLGLLGDVCAAAFDAIPPEEKTATIAALETIRAGWPARRDVVGEYCLELRLYTLGRALAPRHVDQLPPAVQWAIEEAARTTEPLMENVAAPAWAREALLRRGAPRIAARMDRHVALTEGPASRRFREAGPRAALEDAQSPSSLIEATEDAMFGLYTTGGWVEGPSDAFSEEIIDDRLRHGETRRDLLLGALRADLALETTGACPTDVGLVDPRSYAPLFVHESPGGCLVLAEGLIEDLYPNNFHGFEPQQREVRP